MNDESVARIDPAQCTHKSLVKCVYVRTCSACTRDMHTRVVRLWYARAFVYMLNLCATWRAHAEF